MTIANAWVFTETKFKAEEFLKKHGKYVQIGFPTTICK